eukprot:jgi/Bigna1/81861/fgenesh1_pg.85_\
MKKKEPRTLKMNGLAKAGIPSFERLVETCNRLLLCFLFGSQTGMEKGGAFFGGQEWATVETNIGSSTFAPPNCSASPFTIIFVKNVLDFPILLGKKNGSLPYLPRRLLLGPNRVAHPTSGSSARRRNARRRGEERSDPDGTGMLMANARA